MGIFDGFDDAEVGKVKDAGTFVTVPEGWSPIHEQTPSDAAYIILSGEVSIRQDKQEVARVGAGEVIGEAGMVNRKLRNASAVALSRLELLRFSGEQLQQLSKDVPAFREALERSAAAHGGGTDES